MDAANPVRVIFENPIEARYVRVNPYTWVGTISLQVDILGCQTMNNTTEAPESFTTFAYLETTTQPPTQGKESEKRSHVNVFERKFIFLESSQSSGHHYSELM